MKHSYIALRGFLILNKRALVLAALALLLAGCGLRKPDGKTVLDHDPGFTCTLPDGWWVDDLDPVRPDSTAWTDKNDTAKVHISVFTIPNFEAQSEETVRLYGESNFEAIKSNKRYRDVKLISQGPITLDGSTGWEVAFSGVANQRDRWRRMILVFHPDRKGRVVDLTFLANPGTEREFSDEFQKVLDSWKWQ
ncbi:MAG: hypothetical protein HY319_10200 [Armatimonadetes bacterium]|nr:hypothetical protein [Armatimonadota bacterium]